MEEDDHPKEQNRRRFEKNEEHRKRDFHESEPHHRTAKDKYYDVIKKFAEDKDAEELPFPSSLQKSERKAIHQLAVKEEFKLCSLSVGKGLDRHITVSKKSIKLTPDKFNIRTKKILIRDFNLPIPTADKPYFEYFMKLIDPFHKTSEIANMAIEAISVSGGEGGFSGLCDKLEKEIIQSITSVDAYQHFANENLDEFQKKFQVDSKSFPKKHIYNPKNNGKYFISLDLKSANFNSLRFYDSTIVMNCNTWDEFVKKFTPLQYFSKAKMWRQRIFGKLGSEPRQKMVSEHMIYSIYKRLIDSGTCAADDLQTFNRDEVVFVAEPGSLRDTVNRIKDIIETDKELENIKMCTRLEAFRISQLFKKNPQFFAKEIFTDLDDSQCSKNNSELSINNSELSIKNCELSRFSTQIKGANAQQFALCCKQYLQQPVHQFDSMFLEKDKLEEFQ